VLFAGIFDDRGARAGAARTKGFCSRFGETWQFFVASGVLSGVLDNAAHLTLAFLTRRASTASALGLPPVVGGVPGSYLRMPISAGRFSWGPYLCRKRSPNSW